MINYTDPLNGNMVITSDSEMSASMLICQKENRQKYSADEISSLLAKAGIKNGVDIQKVNEVIDREIYNKEICIASGKPAIEGQDGEFEFHFKTALSYMPYENEDGSVDYSKIDFFIPVTKDTEIVTYHKGNPGMMGFTVTGRLLTAKRGREKPAIMGRGFKISDDGCHYTSLIDGKISYDEDKNRITISEMLSIDTDLTIKEGNINFRGAVYVRGAVRSGMKICASGNVTVDGIVEAAEVKAGGSILLRSGTFGNNKGVISAGKDIVGKFFEKCTVSAGNDISCSYIMESNVEAGRTIEVLGKKGLILAGEIRSFAGITSNSAGNEFGTLTRIIVGIDQRMTEKIEEIDEQVSKTDSEISIFKKGLVTDSPMRDRIEMALSVKVSKKIELVARKEALMQRVDKAASSFICIRSHVYPGVQVVINQDTMLNQKELTNVTFRKAKDHIGIFKNNR